jgi:hypothetical protein
MSSCGWAYSYNYVVIDWVTHRPLGGGLARLHLWLEDYRFVQFWCDLQDYALGSPNFLITRSPSPPCAASQVHIIMSFGRHGWHIKEAHCEFRFCFFFSFPPVAASCVKMKHPWNQSPNQRFGWFWSCCGKIGKILWTDKHPKPEMLVIFGSVHSFFSIDRGRSWPIASLFFRGSSPLQPLVLLHSGGSQDPGLNAFGGAGLTGGFWRIFMGLYSLNGILVRLMGF